MHAHTNIVFSYFQHETMSTETTVTFRTTFQHIVHGRRAHSSCSLPQHFGSSFSAAVFWCPGLSFLSCFVRALSACVIIGFVGVAFSLPACLLCDFLLAQVGWRRSCTREAWTLRRKARREGGGRAAHKRHRGAKQRGIA